MGGGVNVCLVARALGPRVDGKVLGCADDLEVLWIRALQTFDELHAESSREIWVFAIGLLTATPARIPEDVDVGRPEGQAVVDIVVAVAQCFIVLRTRFGGDGVADPMKQRCVPGRGHADGLRKHGGVSGAGHAVKSFIPVVVCRNMQPWNGGSGASHLAYLFFQRQPRDKIVRARLGR
jgi:hypothetical protein